MSRSTHPPAPLEKTAKKLLWLAGALVPALLAGMLFTSSAPQETAAAEETKKETCLTCHGPFDQLAEKTANHQTLAGETLTPHRRVPHDNPSDEAIPECYQCHAPQPHPIPPEEADIAAAKERQKPQLDYCYSCHHIREFISCKTCHQGKPPSLSFAALNRI